MQSQSAEAIAHAHEVLAQNHVDRVGKSDVASPAAAMAGDGIAHSPVSVGTKERLTSTGEASEANNAILKMFMPS